MHKVLILTTPKDAHGRIIYEGLRRKGANPVRWFTDEAITKQKSTLSITSNGIHYLKNESEQLLDLIDADVVWNRRPLLPIIPNTVHPDDYSFIQRESRYHHESLMQVIGSSAQWINPETSYKKSTSKALQLKEAARVGLKIPDTLITNNKTELISFIEKHQGQGTIYKTFFPSCWEEQDKSYSLYTTAIDVTQIPDENVLQLTPGIFQQNVPKAFEVRATFFGKENISVKIHNTKMQDWRKLSSTNQLTLSPLILPQTISQQCIALMDALGIVFGCFDFIVTPNNEYIFLEVNEMGQFLWIETLLPEARLLDTFCNFVLSFNKKNSPFITNEKLTLDEIEGSESYQTLLNQDKKHANIHHSD